MGCRNRFFLFSSLLFLCLSSQSIAQSPIILPDCGVSYIDPQDGSPNTMPGLDTLVYQEYFSDGQALRRYFIDINAFGGLQADRAKVYAIMPDSSLKLMGGMAFGNCVGCLDGFALVDDNVLAVQGVSDVNTMNMWLASYNQPAFALTGNLQTLTGVGRLSGKLPFCAIGWRVEYSVFSDPNTSSTEFSTHILCIQTQSLCPLTFGIDIDCQNDSLYLFANVPANCLMGPAQAQWSNAGGVAATIANAALPLTPANLGMYYLTFSDDCCILQDSVWVQNPDFAQAGPDISICDQESVTLAGSGGAGHFWEKAGGAVINDSLVTIPAAQATDAGLYILHAFNAEGCEDTDTLLLEVHTPPLLDIAVNTPCLGDTLFLGVNNDTAFVTIKWQDPQGNVLGQTFIPDFQTGQIGTYAVTGTDPFGCAIQQEVMISGSEPPEVEYLIEESCDSSRIYIYPPDFQYTWETGLIGPIFATATGGTFAVTVTDPLGCSSVLQIEAPLPEGPGISLEVEQPFCPGDYGEITIVAENPDRPMIFSIDGGQTYSLSPHFDKLSYGTYHVAVLDDLGCLQQFEVIIETPDTMGVSLGIDYLEMRPNTPVSLQAQTVGQIQTYQWLPEFINTGTATTDFVATNSMDVRIIVEDDKGCLASDGFHLEIVLGDIYAPNAFSPNSDGINDRFTFYSDNGSGEIITALRIYNRWGDLFFEATDIALNDESKGWDGQFGGKPANPGIYAYHGIIRFGNGAIRHLKGDVLLIR